MVSARQIARGPWWSEKMSGLNANLYYATMRQQVPIRKAPLFVISFFAMLWLLGILSDEPRQIFTQAIRICLSCIGIG